MATSGSKLLSQEERRKQKELEEARKAGLVAPEVCLWCETAALSAVLLWQGWHSGLVG